MPSFQPVKGERSELSTIEGRTMAIGKIASAAREHGFAEALRERVGIRPAQMLRTLQPDAHQPIARPASAIALQHAFEFLAWNLRRFIAAAAQRLAAQALSSSSGLSARSSTWRIVSRSEAISRSASKSGSFAGL